jgi:hypothetical protein
MTDLRITTIAESEVRMHSSSAPLVRQPCSTRRLFALALLLAVTAVSLAWTQPPQAGYAVALDRKLLADAKAGSEIMANLTYLSDHIGARLTGSPALKRANDWTAAKMKEYGLVNVRLEAWEMPEGWRRGHAHGRIIDPDNGRTLSLASYGWMPGTKGKIQADVVVLTATKEADLAAYQGKLKGKIVLQGPPVKLRPLAEVDQPGGMPTSATEFTGKDKQPPSYEEILAFRRTLREFVNREGAAAVFVDAAKHFGLLMTTGGWGKWSGTDRPSADNRVPTLSVAHEHYALLYRLATRPAPARTRVELDVANEFIPGPIAVYNTVGEIRGSEKPDEFVVIGAHLDSWDLGQGTLDNGTGTTVVLETARILARCGTAPKRTIRFVLFTGEEQGLHGALAYVAQHKDEMPRTSACIVHDTGTGKVTGLGWFGRPALKPILERELATLKEIGLVEPHTRGGGGSDHAAFEQAGVPGGYCKQEIAGYRFGHHSQADTLGMAREADLVQGAQVLAVTAMRLANLDTLLPREKK